MSNLIAPIQQQKHHPWILLSICLTMIMLSATSNLYASQTTNDTAKQQIINAITQFTKTLTSQLQFDRIESTLPQLDPRLTLHPCENPIEITNKSGQRTSGKLTLKASCPSGKHWAIHIPIEVKTFSNVVVTNQPVFRGQSLSTDKLAIEERETNRLHRGYFSVMAQVAGSIAKRTLPAGKVIAPIAIVKPMLVNKGEKVLIEAANANISIKTSGIAQSGGSLGDLIQVKNEYSQRVIEGRITAPGIITVSF